MGADTKGGRPCLTNTSAAKRRLHCLKAWAAGIIAGKRARYRTRSR
nr:MAG TPA: hypothetical protein [Caudoviricetes sp.]DAQ46262.1 MAG TPA: hypothetical protein [Caudoviricetes sp.]